MIPRLTMLAMLAIPMLLSPAPDGATAAQTPSARQQGPASQQANGCETGSRAEAATPPARNTGDGTAPGNAGSTGWSGGTGGSHIGTNTSGAVNGSRTWQPPTARGLDPIGAPKRASC
ncbi:hypothetical protein [Teichococcus oryzae]|uniref:hypothetical protein n=1 Tax=Teichococcus oryzae TaxID=1608942 RepID=UPI0019D6107B|nr:hypothetical protein [Pseudoroseomonas oryzae]